MRPMSSEPDRFEALRRVLPPLRLLQAALVLAALVALGVILTREPASPGVEIEDRKSTRLNSSH